MVTSRVPTIFSQLGVSVTESASLDSWLEGVGGFGVHPQGFPVFLDKPGLEALNEYEDGDPYGQSDEQGQLNEFSNWRLERTAALLTENLHKESVVLDVGCGPGQLTSQLAAALPQTSFVGVDGSLTAIQRATEAESLAFFAVADAQNLPFAEGTFDAIILNNLWEHLLAPAAVAASLRKMLKPDGFLLISTPSRFSTANILRAALGKNVGLRSRQHVTEYTVGQVIETLRFVGFRVSQIEGAKFPATTPLQHARRATLGAALDLWKRVTGSHHSFAPTVFFVARRD